MWYRPHDRVSVKFTKPSRAKQEFKAECDINNIMAKYARSGLIEHVNRYQGQYGDFTEVVDYQEALNMVSQAQSAFMSLPASIRTRFENDPGKYLAFVQDPGNSEELVRMGLATKRPETASTAASPPAATTPPATPPEPSSGSK